LNFVFYTFLSFYAINASISGSLNP